MSRVRDRLAAVRGERGLSLVEVLVGVTVFAVLSTLVVGLVSTVSTTFTRDRAATDSTRIASVAMNELTRVIRSGSSIGVQGQVADDPVFLAAGREAVVLRAFLDTDAASPAPVVVRFAVTDTRMLTESRWTADPATAPYWTFVNLPAAPFGLDPARWTNPASTRTIAQMVTPPEASGVSTFRYFDLTGTELVPGPDGLTANQIAGVAAVRITLSVQADLSGRAQPVVLRNSVGIPNLGISRVGPS